MKSQFETPSLEPSRHCLSTWRTSVASRIAELSQPTSSTTRLTVAPGAGPSTPRPGRRCTLRARRALARPEVPCRTAPRSHPPRRGARRAAPRPRPGRPPARRAEVAALVRRCVAAYGGKDALARAARDAAGGAGHLAPPPRRGRADRPRPRAPRPAPRRDRLPRLAAEIRVARRRARVAQRRGGGGPRLASMLLQAARLDLPGAPLGVGGEGGGPRDRRGGRRAASGCSPSSPRPGLVVEASIDVATALIVRSRGASRDPGMPLEFVTTYGDFRKVNGVTRRRSASRTGRTAGPPGRPSSRRWSSRKRSPTRRSGRSG